jgi:myo-inositol-1(or 4)-monophosphatase
LSANDLLNAAVAAAERAAAYLREAPRPDSPAGWTQKAQRDFVTEVDRTSERLIGEVLRAHTPAARIVGEELAPELVRDGLVWVVDPLDGTTNFLHGIPLYAVSIAAVRDGLLEACAACRMGSGSRRPAAAARTAAGSGCTCRASPIRPSRWSAPASRSAT